MLQDLSHNYLFVFVFCVWAVMATFPMWIRHSGAFGPNLNYIGGRLVGKVTQIKMVFARFLEFVSLFLKIDASKSEVSMKFNPDM